MGTLFHLLYDTEKHAYECKEVFGDDYWMYCSYLDQFRKTIEGVPTKIVPITHELYEKL